MMSHQRLFRAFATFWMRATSAIPLMISQHIFACTFSLEGSTTNFLARRKAYRREYLPLADLLDIKVKIEQELGQNTRKKVWSLARMRHTRKVRGAGLRLAV